MKERRVYTKDYKEMIVALINSGQTPVDVANEYGLLVDTVRRWRLKSSRAGDRPIFTGHGNAALTSTEKELLKVRKELSDTKMENAILKKVVGIFSTSDRTNINS